MGIKITGEFDLAYRFISETNKNIFLTGRAGTGKTTFLKYLRENSLKECIVAAPTGVAAINAQGVTLHSLFQLPLGIIPPDSNPGSRGQTGVKHHPLLSKLRYKSDKLDLFQSMELLIIDEASMVASYIVDAVDTILRYVRRKPYNPFGGVQVLFIGDLYQLPPVVKKEDWEILDKFYTSIFFFDSFVLRDNVPVIIELNEIFRQKDSRFIEILNGIRDNDITEENFRLLTSRIKRNFEPADNDEYITLTTHNLQSDEINRQRLKNISSRIHTFEAEIRDEFPESAFPADKELKLKVGAQVMFLKNDTEDKKYFNGKIGVVTELNEHCIKVKCKDDNSEIDVKKSEWQNIRYKVNPETNEIKEEVLGNFIQYPLRLAWAITIHKSQGLTFEKVIVDAERAFAKGQVYVALSRCTSLDGLILKTPVRRNFLGAHVDFTEWHSSNIHNNLTQLFTESRQNYIIDEVQNIFTWKNWYFELKDFKEFLEGNRDKINPEALSWLTELMTKQKELYEVSEKFKQMILNLAGKGASVERNELLQKRISDGARYFVNEIRKWQDRFVDHPIEMSTKRMSEEADKHLGAISSLLGNILHKINLCNNGFVLDNYLRNAGKFSRRIKVIRSSYSKKRALQKKNTVEETVKIFRKVKNIQEVAVHRNLTEGTIEGHIAKAIRGNLIQIDEVIPLDEALMIARYFPDDLNDVRLSSIKETAPPETSYGKLRMVLALLQKGNSE